MPNNMRNNRFTDFMSSKGFYLLLALCLVGSGGAAYLAMGNDIAPPQEETSQVSPGQEIRLPVLEEANKNQNKLPIEQSKPQPSQPTEQPSPEPSSQPEEPSQPSTAQASSSGSAFSLPIASEVFAKFSNGDIVYDVTMEDWRTHNGIDISAAQGTEVKASASGKVRDVRSDQLWGGVVEIEHAGNIVTVYCGLASEFAVKKGDTVKAGQVLGTVSHIQTEGKLPTHLHFEMKQNGKFIDPMSKIK